MSELDLLDEFDTSDIRLRDLWQFELKSDFLPRHSNKETSYTQEFYLFIPHALQINNQTYSQKEFYRDETNFIRVKTPIFTLNEISDLNFSLSPNKKILELADKNANRSQIIKEIKLLGNIVRSSARTQVRIILSMLENLDSTKKEQLISIKISALSDKLRNVLETNQHVQGKVEEQLKDPEIEEVYKHVNAFIHQNLESYLTTLLNHIRQKENGNLKNADETLCQLLKEKIHLTRLHEEPEEEILYQKGMLKKYVMDALLLNINRFSFRQRYQNLIGAAAAGLSMFVYFTLFIWGGGVFVINSFPFILVTVVLYILKDRMKEGLRDISYLKATKWYSDYTTEIRSPDKTAVLGKLRESFSFVRSHNLPKEIDQIRNVEFHTILGSFKRNESVIYYKKRMKIYARRSRSSARRHMMNIIFRFNINRFLQKTADPVQNFLTFDPTDNQLVTIQLPKVYHINIILKTTIQEKPTKRVELRKFRLVVDKNGIKRVEEIQ